MAAAMAMKVPTLETDSKRMTWVTLSLLVRSLSEPVNHSDNATPSPGIAIPGLARDVPSAKANG
jgi:hypothetical protein